MRLRPPPTAVPRSVDESRPLTRYMGQSAIPYRSLGVRRRAPGCPFTDREANDDVSHGPRPTRDRGALFAIVGNPLFGSLSDGSRSRFGRRRSCFVGGMLAGLADRSPASQRGKVSGIAGVCNYSSLALAAYVAGWFSSSTALMFSAPAVIGLLLVLASATRLREERPTE